ncbi:hypothetical protein [Dendronalium sp. ChiSLP03b]|uniref:hypothetical protein n=1 Tax=Dendronalium sp. ChiSLP03b TaxID=3075381 RepID=UPI00391B44E5
MFGFDGNFKGFEIILRRIAETTENNGNLTHKEIRAYARCMLKILPEITFDEKLKLEIEILLAALSASGLPLYDRSFLATRILKLLEEDSKSKSESKGEIF